MSRKSAYSQFLYIIAESPQGPCKIGIAGNPHQRLGNMQVGNCRILTIASLWECKRRSAEQMERLLHHLMAKQAMRGEWFDISVEEAERVCLSQDMIRIENAYDYSRKQTAVDTRISWLIQ